VVAEISFDGSKVTVRLTVTGSAGGSPPGPASSAKSPLDEKGVGDVRSRGRRHRSQSRGRDQHFECHRP